MAIHIQALRYARVNEESHSFTCHPHISPQVEWTIAAFTPQPQVVTAPHCGRYSFSVLLEVECLAWVAGYKPT